MDFWDVVGVIFGATESVDSLKYFVRNALYKNFMRDANSTAVGIAEDSTKTIEFVFETFNQRDDHTNTTYKNVSMK